jgi:transcriptional regulator with XRE-family HTH domain
MRQNTKKVQSTTPFGEYICAKREGAGLAISAVARRLGISSTHLRDVELGRRAALSDNYWPVLARTITGITKKELARVYRESTSTVVKIFPGHPDRKVVERLGTVIEAGGLTEEQRGKILKILGGDEVPPPLPMLTAD